ncbi:flagellum-specific ATP synthase FliI [Jannaschia sp. LMIT008]|uniref:FliI/YscN family ATPase n=1 Tax=Jannaschia maritima TaxID=3032585 RepID=UPI002812395D|nr:flagellum-specific ATP synthase FliI [Jannaschia sp. LMIT008]
MDHTPLDTLRARVAPLSAIRPLGRVKRLDDGRLDLAGLSRAARLGEEVALRGPGGARAEVVSIDADRVTAMPYGAMDGHGIGAAVELCGPPAIAPADTWLGRIVDPFGAPLDGRPLGRGAARPIHADPPEAGRRAGFGDRLATGYTALDTLLPIVDGQRMGVFAGSGVGKSRLLGDLANRMEADVVVTALVGERGREVSGFARDVLGADGMRRTVVVAATSDRAANVRRRCVPAALAVAEHFRDRGAKVLFLCDSLTRHAESCRDVAAATGQRLDGGMPPGLTANLAALVERTGPGSDGKPAITSVFTVLVAGSDMEGPVADTVRGLIDGHVVLSRGIAEGGRYPAIDVLASVSRSLPDCATPEQNALLGQVRAAMETYRRNELMVTSGLYEKGRDPALDAAIRLRPALEAALSDRSGGVDDSFDRLRAAMT